MNERKLPALVWAAALVGVGFFLIPILALVFSTPWNRLGELLTSDVSFDALRLSAVASLSATALAALVGIPIAVVLARADFPGRTILRAVVLLPLVLPPVVGGTALLLAFGRRGIVGSPLFEATGLTLPFSIWGVVVAVTFVSMPFMVLTVEGAIRGLDERYEGVALSLGASTGRVLRKVTLPMVAPSIGAGLILTWARAFGEFGATVAFAGSLQGRTDTLPLAVFVSLVTDREAAIALSLLMMAISVVVLVALRDRWLTR